MNHEPYPAEGTPKKLLQWVLSMLLWPLTGVCSLALALDLNTASEADLDTLHGIGPAITQRLMQARAQAHFTDWADVRQRVKGIGPKLVASLVAQGVTVHAAHETPTTPPITSNNTPTIKSFD